MARKTVTFPSIDTERCGFTLLEVMAGLVIIVIALFGLISVQVRSLKGQTFKKDRHQAVTLASSKMALVEAALEEDFDADVEETLADIPGYPGYSLEVESQESDGSPDLKQVTTRVYWKVKHGRLNYELETSVARVE